MKRMLLVTLGLLAATAASTAIAGPNDMVIMRNAPQQVAVLPDQVRYPEGLAVNPANGDIFVGTFDFGPNANKLLRYSKTGKLLAVRDFGGTPLLGLGFDAATGQVYILNMGAQKVQRISANFTATTVPTDVADVPSLPPALPRTVGNPDGSNDVITFGDNPGFGAPNAMLFDGSTLYFSDSFRGAIFSIANFRTCSTPCAVSTFVQDPLLATAGFPPFGANGIALDADATTMFIANTGDNRVLALDMASKAVAVFAESVHGADGLAFDGDHRLWVAANQADEVVEVNDNGRIVTRLGEFQGLRHDGTPQGLLFPASIAIVGDWLYVTNLALPLNNIPGDEVEEDVQRWTISRMKLPQR